ncbi:MAG TPA: hypothetical protein VFG10_02370 [Saprospiraceae bacterium]|nr:hypothetical protein [Saprospiraceae bacterium]
MTPFVKRDSFWLGLGAGLLVPALAYAILLTIYQLLDTMGVLSDIGFAEDFRIRTLALFAVCSNLILMNRYRKSYHHETIRGILMASMLLVGIWFWIFGFKILSN